MFILRKHEMRMGLLITLALILSFALAGSAIAAPLVPNPTTAIYPDTQIHTIAPNTAVWYRFEYAGDNSTIRITMPNHAKFGPTFELYTPEEMQSWWKAEPIGMSNDEGDDHFWVGNFPIAGTYYIKVVNDNAFTSEYQLLVTGKGVTMGAKVAPPQIVTQPAPKPLEANITPERAIMLDSQPRVIAPNAELWYRVAYAPDKPVELKVMNGAKSGIKFEVYVQDQLANWWKVDPTGMGTADGDHLLWRGFAQADLPYFVRVINEQPYKLEFQFVVQIGSGPY